MSRSSMRCRGGVYVLALALGLFASVDPIAQEDEGPLYVPGELLVKLKPEATDGDRSAILARLSAQSLRLFRSGAEHWTLGGGIDTTQALELLASNPNVQFAEPNYIVQADLIPDDTRYPELWGLHNTGQTGGTPGADIDAELAWDITTGAGSVVVAVIDTGVDYGHPDLVDNIWTNPGEIPGNGLDDDGNGYVDDVHGWDFINNDNDPMDDHSHGTHVSGTIGARGNNGLGVVGVSWQVRIMALKFLGAGGSGSTADAVRAVEYATLMGVDITNNSWGGGGFSQALLDAINAGGQAGVLFVAAAGNSGLNTDISPHYPSSYDSDAVLSVAATDADDRLAGFSNYGATTVDLGAPGVSTLSSVPGGGYGFKSGTSMAAPHVSGAAALLRSLRPGLELGALKGRLMNEGDPIPALAGTTVSGNRLNAYLAVREPDDIAPGGVADLTVESVGITDATLIWTAPGDDGTTGTASSYHLRYALVPFTEQNFEAGTLVSGMPPPQIAGSAERFTVTGLRARTTYYFAVKAVDEWGNRGPLVNDASGTTLPGIPEISLQDQPISTESTQAYGISGALTLHDLPVSAPPEGGGSVELTANGDFGDSTETATVTAEGLSLGSVGAVGVDCARAIGTFPLTPEDLAQLAADGNVHVEVQNSANVDTFCDVNEHRVQLNYRPTATGHDYGAVFVTGSLPWTVRIANDGNDVLDVTSITSDLPEFVPSDTSLSIDPGSWHDLVVTFAPSSVALFQGTLRIQSNDPDESDLSLDLTGEGLTPPDIAVVPDRFDEALFSGESVTRILTISNTGESDLVYEIQKAGPPAAGGEGLQQVPGPGVPPSGPGTGAGYADGAEPNRERMSPDDLGAVVDAGRDIEILLIQSGTEVSEIASLLESYPDITAVDVFDAASAVPALGDLQDYGAVILIINSRPGQQDALGNVLADYADSGGRVVMTLASFINGWEVRGRFLGGGYLPFNLGSGPIGSSSLGDYVVGHPIMEGVQDAVGHLLGEVTLAANAEWVADWQFGQPMIATNELGVVGVNVYLGGTGQWSGDVPLILHNAAFYLSDEAPWLATDPQSGTVPPGSSVDVTVTVDATDLFGGTYEARLLVQSNDPDEPEVVVPVVLVVTGVPDIALAGEPVTLESIIPYGFSGARTDHALPLDVTPGGGSDATIELIADGDFGDSTEFASADAETIFLGEVGRTGSDCTAARGSFPLTPAEFAGLAADGTVHVAVQNSANVDTFCTRNEHTVRLSYRGDASALEYGDLFIGLTKTLSIEIRNDGTDVLVISSITTDETDFVPAANSMQLEPRTSQQLDVTFAPSRAGAIAGVLTLVSNDPDEGLLTVDLAGVGLVPPDIAVSPSSIADHLFTGERATHVLFIDNTGGSDLELQLELAPQLANASPGPDDPVSTGQPSGTPPAPSETGGDGVTLADPGILQPPDPDFRFVDDFEDGDLDGWLIVPGSALHEVADLTAADGTTYSYHQSNSPSGHFNGVYQVFGEQQPEYVRFFVRSGSNSANDGYFVIRDPQGLEVVFFFAHGNGRLYVNANVGGDNSFAYTAETWYEIEFRNIDYVAKTFDYYVDGQLVLAAIPFRNSGAVDSFYRLDLYNFDSSSQAWWDEIHLTADLTPDWITLDPLDGVVPPGGTLEVNVQLDAAGLFGGDYHADILIDSNDPDQPEIVVPVDLQVTGAPDIQIRGEEFRFESTEEYTSGSDTTDHAFAIETAPIGEGTIEVVADGDFGSASEYATVTAEGNTLGQVGAAGSDCIPASGTFPLTAEDLGSLAADGVVEVRLRNTSAVHIICAVNEHRVALTYAGAADLLDFGQVFTGYTASRAVVIENVGTDVLNVTSITADLPEYTPSVGSMVLDPLQSMTLEVTFAPVGPGLFDGVLTIASNDADEPLLTIALTGEGLIPPDIGVTPSALTANLFSDEIAILPLTIDNSGGSDLHWSVAVDAGVLARVVASTEDLAVPPVPPPVKETATTPPDPPDPADVYAEPIPADRPGEPSVETEEELQALLDQLNERHQEITDRIPNRYDFSEGETGSSINDGGGDMYDGGNFLSTNLGGSIPYSNNTIVARDDLLGSGGRYFTRKYPGLFVFVADVAGLDSFTISGNLGADGAGQVNGSVLETRHGATTYLGFVKRVYGAGDPSVNHLIIVQQDPAVSHEFSVNTNSDYHRLTGATNVQRIHYLLYAGSGGAFIDDGAALEIMQAFLGLTPLGWITVAPDAGTTSAGASTELAVTFDATALFEGDYHADVFIASNDPDEPTVVVPADLHVTGIPDIHTLGKLIEVSSSAQYNTVGASTSHVLTVPQPPAGGGSLGLVADGDFGGFDETADISAEGAFVGRVGGVGRDCEPAADEFPIAEADLASWTADGTVNVTVRNSFRVDLFCAINRHTVTLQYRGSADLLEFGSLFIGLSSTLSITVENRGTGTLEVTAITTDDAQYQASDVSLSIPPLESRVLDVTFSPTLAQVSPATLTLASNDPDQPEVYVALEGEGLVPPDIEVTPTSIGTDLFTGQSDSRMLAIGNIGGSDLIWELEVNLGAGSTVLDASPPLNTQSGGPDDKEPATTPPAPPDPAHVYSFGDTAAPGPQGVVTARPALEDLLLELDANFSRINSLIPNRYDFIGGDTGTSIPDGGGDMYDGGNFLGTDLGGPIPYSNGPILQHSALGAAGRYFTRKYPGLFVLVADLDGVDHFTITGNLGADGSGLADGSILQTSVMGVTYLGLVKRVYNAGDPSVNHLVIVESDPQINHEFSTNTNDDYHRVFLRLRASRLHYLLYAARSGGYIDDSATLEIMNAYLSAQPVGWISVDPTSGVVPAEASAEVVTAMTAVGLEGGDYQAVLAIDSNDPDEPVVEVPVTMHVTSAPDIEVRGALHEFESTQDFAVRGAVTSHSFDQLPPPAGVGQLELILEGDFGAFTETATLTAEGIGFAPVGRVGGSCVMARGVFPLSANQMTQLAADSRLDAQVHNSADVDPTCSTNRHTVRFSYRGPDDRLDYGELFIGLTRRASILVLNNGVLNLNVSAITTDEPDFTATPSSMVLAPGDSGVVDVTFAPSVPGPITGVLRLTSDDPDEGVTDLSLSGIGVIPPDIDVTPDSIAETVLIGRQVVSPLVIANTNVGGADLIFQMRAAPSGGLDRPNAPLPPPQDSDEVFDGPRSEQRRDGLTSGRPPEDYEAAAAAESAAQGAEVLIIQDDLAWGTSANQSILSNNGIAFDQIRSSSLSTTDLTRYKLVIVPSDQRTSFYSTIASRRTQLEAWVGGGGTLEFHAAGWGWNSGNAALVTLPHDVGIVRGSASENFVIDPTHPAVAGVPDRFTGSSASHCYLDNLPPDARAIVRDSFARTNLAEYRFGLGRVVVGCQTFEFGYTRGQVAGLILNNMIPWTFSTARRIVWLTPTDASGVVVAEDSLQIDMTLDATDLEPQVYEAVITIESNDPDEPEVVVPAAMEAVRLIAEAGPPQELECDGNNSAITTLDGTGSEHMDGPGGITWYGWFLGEVALGEGAVLMTPIPLGEHTVRLEIADAVAATSQDETVVTVDDTIPPVGGITAPAPGTCHGPALVPLSVLDDFTDVCDPVLDRTYDCSSPTGPGGACPDATSAPPYSGHGDYLVAVTATDERQNPHGDSVSFVIDTMPPSVQIIGPPAGAQHLLPDDLPFDVVFEADDDDGALGDIVHEVVLIEGCPAFDGHTYGNTLDGLLRNETVTLDEQELCRISEQCGFTSLNKPELRVDVEDCGGNLTPDTRILTDGIALRPGLCTSISLDVAAADATAAIWDVQPGAQHYDVIRGDLANLVEDTDWIDLGQVLCLERDSLDTNTIGHEDTEQPPAGRAFFYVVQSDDGTMPSGYGRSSNGKRRVAYPQNGACD